MEIGIFFFNKFIYFWLHWVFVAARGPSLAAARGGHSSPRCAGLSPRRPLSFWRTGSRRAGPSSWGAQAQPLHGTWDPPRPGREPSSPALAGRLPATAPPGKPEIGIFPITLPVKTAKGFKREGYGATMPGAGSWLTTHLGKSLNLPLCLCFLI